MAKLMARAGKPLTYRAPGRRGDEDGTESADEETAQDEDELQAQLERNYVPLMVWQSPHNGGDAVGLPPTLQTVLECDEYGVEENVTKLCPQPHGAYSKQDQYVPKVLAKWLRSHQREGVKFMYECVMGMRDFDGQGCILADDMGLGKTLQSVCLIYTLLKTGITARAAPTAKRVIVVCPCSLVKNWDNEFVKWLGPGTVKTIALAESDRKTVEKNLDVFVKTKMFNVLIASYETMRTHIGRLNRVKDCCDLLVCDEAHRLKNRENQTSKALFSLPCKRRVLLTGTPMQNDLTEFFAMVDFINPGVLGTEEEFRKNYLSHILRGREPDATDRQKEKMNEKQNEMSTTVNDFILRRVNTLNAQHLPPKLVQVVCCNLTEIQQNMYQHLVNSKATQHVLDGKQVNCLSSIQMLMKLCNHPSLIASDDSKNSGMGSGRRAASKKTSYAEEEKSSAAPGADGVSRFLPFDGGGGGRSSNAPVHPEWSGKLFVLYRLMREMRKPGNGNDKIVIISNYTQTLDIIGRMCRENSWGCCRLDGSVSMKKRQQYVDEFNDPSSSLVAFLLSSKAGGCGLNLIGGNRLVLFDPDWNPAIDKQAAARCWRDGQKKRCFTYRFLATGTVEEKIFQRQLSKEGLQSVVDDKDQVNTLSSKDLKNLFKLRTGTPSDTHDKLKCERCNIIADDQEAIEKKVLPKKLAACKGLLERMVAHEDSAAFLTPLKPEEHGASVEEYEKRVKQPIDLGTIAKKLDVTPESGGGYKSVSSFSKDVNRIFTNVMKVWEPGQDIADAGRRLQAWWLEEWTSIVPIIMSMKPDDDKEKENAGPKEDGICGEEKCAEVDNERGEDYQDQLGMPDEEDMRSWSHHYNTDTVDDPVFRAAMRGYDSVSFVFGLEVTWSLIQQKAQEEEERLAMEEMQRLEELEKEAGLDGSNSSSSDDDGGDNGSDSDSDSDDDLDKKPKAKNCDKDEKPKVKKRKVIEDSDSSDDDDDEEDGDDTMSSDPPSDTKPETKSEEESDEEDDDDATWEVSKVFSELDITGSSPVMCQDEDCEGPRRAAALWKSSKGEELAICQDCQESSMNGWPDGVEPTADSHKRAISKWCSGVPGDADDFQEESEEEMEIVADDDNEGEDAVMNGSDSEEESVPEEANGESSDEEQEEEETPSFGWTCTSCTFVNEDESLKKCGACDTRRPRGPPRR